MSSFSERATPEMYSGLPTSNEIVVCPQAQILRDVGGLILANACGPCIGQWDR